MKNLRPILLFIICLCGHSAFSCDFVCPPNVEIECDISGEAIYADYESFMQAGGSVSNCNADINTASFGIVAETSDGSICPQTITRVYQIEDVNQNHFLCEQIITINDFNPPVLLCPSDIEADNSILDFPPYVDLQEFQVAGGGVFENCTLDNSSFEFYEEFSDGNSCPETFTRVYVIGDLCGNTGTCEQNLVLSEPSESNIEVSACSSYTSPSGNYTWTETGVYEDVIQTVEGCDSLITITLTIESGIVVVAYPGIPGSLETNLACASFLNEIIIPTDSDTIRVDGPLFIADDITIRSESASPAVIEFDFSNDAFLNQSNAIEITNGKNVKFENIDFVAKDRNVNQNIVSNNGNLSLHGIIKLKSN